MGGHGTVYTFKPEDPGSEITLLKPEPAVARPGITPVLPVGNWAMLSFTSATGTPIPRPHQYVSPDGTTYIFAGEDFAKGTMSWGIKSADLLRGFGLAPAVPGKRFYMTGEADVRTWSALVGPDGNLSDLKLFAEQGGEGVTTDSEGNVYIAAGKIYVYNPSGKLIETIEMPERPLQLLFGGKDGRTLYIPARTSLYSIRTRIKG